MSFKKIRELRQSGKLEEAMQMALQALDTEPDDIWNKRSAAWVYYDYLKKYARPDTYSLFRENLIRIKDLQLPEEENMVFDNCGWQIGSMVFSLQKNEPVDYTKLNELFAIIREFHFTKPSEVYTLLYKAFHKGYQNWSEFLAFADWWDLDNLRSEDYLKEEYQGKKIMSVAEQAYIAYSRKLLEGVQSVSAGHDRNADRQKIELFLPKLDRIIEKHPEYQYPPYFKAKLLLAMGSDENALNAFLPFARQKRNDFWVWEVMAEIFSEDKSIQFECYCKALSLKTPEDFLVKIRQKFAEMLIERKMFSEAKTEIQKVISIRVKQEWGIPNQITHWTEQSWYSSASAKKDNQDLYSSHLRKAEEILFQDIPEEIIVVEFVNESKNMLSFVKNKRKYGFFNYSGYLTGPHIGDLVKVRFSGDGQDNFFKVLTAKKAESKLTSEAIKNFEGTLKIIPPQNFGFIGDIFIEPKLLQATILKGGESVKGRAILSFNKKKNEWGWKAIEIE